MIGYLYIAGTVLFTVYGQIVLKWRIVNYGELPVAFNDKLFFLFKLLFDPYIFSGFLSAFIASFFWMAAMTKFELSHAYPIIVGGLAFATSIFAIFLLKETITLYKVLGFIFIVFGVYFVSKA